MDKTPPIGSTIKLTYRDGEVLSGKVVRVYENENILVRVDQSDTEIWFHPAFMIDKRTTWFDESVRKCCDLLVVAEGVPKPVDPKKPLVGV